MKKLNKIPFELAFLNHKYSIAAIVEVKESKNKYQLVF
jgi:hypothetical protein